MLLKRRHDAVNHRNWINVQDAFHLFELIGIWWARFMIFLKPRTNVLISFRPWRCKLILFKAVALRLALQMHMFSFLSKEMHVLNTSKILFRWNDVVATTIKHDDGAAH